MRIPAILAAVAPLSQKRPFVRRETRAAADFCLYVQDRDGGISLLSTLFGLFPFLRRLFADGAYDL